ncbi:transcriptional regulator [Glycomyces tarimensis]
MISVLLADDDALTRAGIRAILTTEPGIAIVAEAADGQQAVALAQRHRPRVAVLDIRMPRLDGISAAKEIRRTMPDTAVIMLTTFGQDAYIADAIAVGSSGFLLKTGGPRDIIAGVRAAADGAAFLSPKVAHRIISHMNSSRLARGPAARSSIGDLTEREREVLSLVGSGASNAQIAADLHLTEGTVKGHVSMILSKLGLANRVQAAILAYDAGLVDHLRE